MRMGLISGCNHVALDGTWVLEDNADMVKTRARLNGCIGCGGLSLKTCAPYTKSDRIARHCSGPRYLIGDAVEID